jgi:hypothetical protein
MPFAAASDASDTTCRHIMHTALVIHACNTLNEGGILQARSCSLTTSAGGNHVARGPKRQQIAWCRLKGPLHQVATGVRAAPAL